MLVSSENSFIDIPFTSKICFSRFAMPCPLRWENQEKVVCPKCNIQTPTKLQQLQALQPHL